MGRYGLPAVMLVCIVLAGSMAGCTPEAGVTSTPAPTELSTPAVVETPPPTPQWEPDEQAAVDAVQTYIEKWAYIGQNLPDVDVNAIRQVAGDPVANKVLLEWATWIKEGLHLVGAPVFETIRVSVGATDDQGTRYHVYGCYDMSQSYLADNSGTAVQKSAERATVLYLVLSTPDDGDGVLEEAVQQEKC